MDDDTPAPAGSPAAITEQIIDRFGGIRPMATKLDMPVTTVQGWKKRGAIPATRHADILAAASRAGIEIDAAQLAMTDPGGTPERTEPRAFSASPDDFARPSPSASGARSGGGLALSLAVLALIVAVGGVGAVWQFYIHPLRGHVAGLEARLAKLEPGTDLVRRLDVLESEVAQRPATAVPNTAGGDHIAALEQDVARLKADSEQTEQLAKRLGDLQIAAGGRELLAQSIVDIQSSAAATQGEVERLNGALKAATARLDQVDAVLADRRQQALRAEAVILAVGQLRAALRGSKPFTQEIAALRAVSDNDGQFAAAVDTIKPMADSGVPTSDDLRGDLSRLAPEIVRGAVVGDGSKWWRQALYRIASVISIRRTGETVPGDKADAVVARAEAKLDEDDLEGAVATMRMLHGLPADTAAPWLHDAEQRLTADAAEAELTRLAIARVTPDRPEPVSAPTAAPPAVAAPVTAAPATAAPGAAVPADGQQ